MKAEFEHKIPPFLPISIAFLGDRRLKRLNKDLPNCQGIGIVFSIFLELVKDKSLSYPLDDIDILADDINTSKALTTTVVTNYKLFQFFKDKTGKRFFSPDLKMSLEPYFKKVEINRENAKIGAKKKELKRKQQLLELEAKLSTDDSTERPQSDGSANVIYYNLNNTKDKKQEDFLKEKNDDDNSSFKNPSPKKIIKKTEDQIYVKNEESGEIEIMPRYTTSKK